MNKHPKSYISVAFDIRLSIIISGFRYLLGCLIVPDDLHILIEISLNFTFFDGLKKGNLEALIENRD